MKIVEDTACLLLRGAIGAALYKLFVLVSWVAVENKAEPITAYSHNVLVKGSLVSHLH